MQLDWSAYRITLLLYIGVLILPFSFYYTYTSLQNLEANRTILYQLNKSGAEILAVTHTQDPQERSRHIKEIDKTLFMIKPWFKENNRKEFYVGGRSLLEDYDQLLKYWNILKNDLYNNTTTTALQYWKHTRSLSFIIEKMVLLKEAKIYNLLYLTFAITIILLLLLIYSVRAYIYIQIKKHAIHDHETKLFNKKYFLSEIKTTLSRSIRYKYPLSILSITIVDFDKMDNIYDKNTKTQIFKIFGALIISLTRASDVACRYDKNSFFIILPFTEEKDALILEERIRKAFEKHDFFTTPKPKFKFATDHLNYEETAEAFVTRIENLLHK
jgi:diguanylate cyclase (GGDEF)-like protein